MHKLHTLTGIAALAALSLTTAAQAAVVYEQDFSEAVGYAESSNYLTYGEGKLVDDGEFGGNIYQSADFTTGANGKMSLNSVSPHARQVRTGATLLFIDTSSWVADISYTVTFDVADYLGLADGKNDSGNFGVFEGNIAAGATLSLRNINTNGTGDPSIEGAQSSGTYSFAKIDSNTGITADGPISRDFTLTEAGSAGDYLMFSWNTWTPKGGPSTASFSVDNITVVPELGTYALLAGMTGLVYVMLRRRR